jgi:hypothetical protein
MQKFEVAAICVSTGEEWRVWVDASDPPTALAKVLRRKLWAEWLCSEATFTFRVNDEFE